jgi:hypothetical protein
MGSSISENLCMINTLNDFTSDYDLQLGLLGRRNDGMEKRLTLLANLFGAHQALKKWQKIKNDDVLLSLLEKSSSITFYRIYKA